MNDLTLDAVVLAGGRGSRLGGIDKAAIRLNGERLVDRAVGAARAAGAAQTVVVGPDHAAAAEVTVVREDPPFTGPLAALAAALPLLRSEWVLVLSCDLVRPHRVCDVLMAALSGSDESRSLDGFALRDSEGRAQWLSGLYRLSELRSAAQRIGSGVENAPMRRLLGDLELRWIDAPFEVTADIDNPEDLDRAGSAHTTIKGDTHE